ncbi:hypothetical protein [Bifidobacterium callitrichos]|uniref:Uncharacterized protein n=1 Tax=Bifidobacterium callitrichos DSM 23973 TaxID=1437609 RepID=A0A087A909_9BIFI|nr:hypothetical protein [Bifidobacterium callitrichos]KFI55259.1 hypothetical protein BCAL_1275 [Bifidobacterium callitrichos DSM 23973]
MNNNDNTTTAYRHTPGYVNWDCGFFSGADNPKTVFKSDLPEWGMSLVVEMDDDRKELWCTLTGSEVCIPDFDHMNPARLRELAGTTPALLTWLTDLVNVVRRFETDNPGIEPPLDLEVRPEYTPDNDCGRPLFALHSPGFTNYELGGARLRFASTFQPLGMKFTAGLTAADEDKGAMYKTIVPLEPVGAFDLRGSDELARITRQCERSLAP